MTKSSSPSRLDAFFGNPAAAVGMAVVCNVLWGSAFPFIKMGYRLFAIDATDTASIMCFAGLSGPAIRPIALRMVWQAVGAVNIPVIGLGGILTGRDALEFIMAGAAAVQVGTANFLDPKACTRITAEIGEWMDAHGVKTLDEIRGCARG